jgi:uncharacterized protein YceK
MVRKGWRAGLAALAVAGLGGCGTVMNLSPEPATLWLSESPTQRVYGGVRYDAVMGGGALLLGLFGAPGLLPLGAYVLAVDMPLSFVGDTLTLPWTVSAAFDRSRGDPHGYGRPQLNDPLIGSLTPGPTPEPLALPPPPPEEGGVIVSVSPQEQPQRFAPPGGVSPGSPGVTDPQLKSRPGSP